MAEFKQIQGHYFGKWFYMWVPVPGRGFMYQHALHKCYFIGTWFAVLIIALYKFPDADGADADHWDKALDKWIKVQIYNACAWVAWFMISLDSVSS